MSFTTVKQVSGSQVPDVKSRPNSTGGKRTDFGGVVKRILAQEPGQPQDEISAAVDPFPGGGGQQKPAELSVVGSRPVLQKAGAVKGKSAWGDDGATVQMAEAVILEDSSAELPVVDPVAIPAQGIDKKELPVQIPADNEQAQEGLNVTPAVESLVPDAAFVVIGIPVSVEKTVPLVDVKNAGDAVHLTVTESAASNEVLTDESQAGGQVSVNPPVVVGPKNESAVRAGVLKEPAGLTISSEVKQSQNLVSSVLSKMPREKETESVDEPAAGDATVKIARPETSESVAKSAVSNEVVPVVLPGRAAGKPQVLPRQAGSMGRMVGVNVKVTDTLQLSTADDSGNEVMDAEVAKAAKPVVAKSEVFIEQENVSAGVWPRVLVAKAGTGDPTAAVKAGMAGISEMRRPSDTGVILEPSVAGMPGVTADRNAFNEGANQAISRGRIDIAGVNTGDSSVAADAAAGIVEGDAIEMDSNRKGSRGMDDHSDTMAREGQGKLLQGSGKVFQVDGRRNLESKPAVSGNETAVQSAAADAGASVDPFLQTGMSATGLNAREVEKFVLNAKRQGMKGVAGDGLASSAAVPAEARTAAASRDVNAHGMVEHMMKRVASLQEVVDRFDKMLMSLTSGRDAGMIIHLVPPNLGKLTVNCKEVGTDLSLNIVADSSFARGFLQNNEQAIREVAANSGFKLSDFDVSTRSEDGAQRRFAGDQEVSERGQGRRTAGKEVPASVAGVSPENWPETNENGGLWFVA